jgi:hypothetical protein
MHDRQGEVFEIETEIEWGGGGKRENRQTTMFPCVRLTKKSRESLWILATGKRWSICLLLY